MSFLYSYQEEAVNKMKNGCILVGGVGSGKSRTSIAYYHKQMGGKLDPFVKMKKPKDLYIITTARKRDTNEWSYELSPFGLSIDSDNDYDNKVIVDSWNNIKKYTNVVNAFFIFDEQRVVGNGTWVKSFLKITRSNEWILLSATPGDTWSDYIPVFIANGFYRNRTEFIMEHVVYSRNTRYRQIDKYLNTRRLVRLRDNILVDMDFHRSTVSHHEDVYCQYDISKYKDVFRLRWNPYTDAPITNPSELCQTLRRIVNTDINRQLRLLEILETHDTAIIFYTYDYELDILRNTWFGEDCKKAEWNGHNHQPIPTGKKWVYFVQYTAGCEGWNCITTDTIIFYSQQYSYKVLEQAAGRINRLNSPFKDLYYYHLKSRSGIDLAISRALKQKKNFNEGRFSKNFI